MSAPTEAEIRAIYEVRAAEYPLESLERSLEEACIQAFDMIDYRPLDTDEAEDQYPHTALGDVVWRDLRPTEWLRLRELVAEHRAGAETRAKAVILEELVSAALAFAAEYPVAPRAERLESVA